MKLRSVLAAVALLVLTAGPASAEGNILAVMSKRVAPYEEALRGFVSVGGWHVQSLIISELPDKDAKRVITRAKPDLILAIGLDALTSVCTIETVPIIYLMVLNPEALAGKQENITGVSMSIAPAKQLSWIKMNIPGIKRIGVLYHPERTGYLLPPARQAAQELGLELSAREIHDVKEVMGELQALKNKVDLLWMLPDIVVYSPEIIEYLLLYSLDNKIPVFTFSRKYVELGALASLDVDIFDMGRQAGRMAEKIISGTAVRLILKADPATMAPSINTNAARRLGIKLGNDALNTSSIVNGEEE